MVNAEFKRDMQQNLLVLKDQDVCQGSFQEKMLEYNSLEGYLPFRIQRMNGERMLFYDLYGVQPLLEVCKRILPDISKLNSLVEGILQIIQRAKEFLLNENDLLLNLEYMFVSLPTYEVKVCYYPGFQQPIKSQLSRLFEELMSCVDYEDRNAVYLVYSLYMKSKEESCTIIDLQQVLFKSKGSIAGKSTDNSSLAKSSISLELEKETRKAEDNPLIHVKELSKITTDPIKTVEKPKNLVITREHELQQKLNSCKAIKEHENQVNQEIPFAMSASIKQTEIKNTHMGTNRRNAITERQHKQPVFRPLISNECEEEVEEFFYPSKCFLLGGVIVLSIVIILCVILKTDILLDPILKTVEPIKLVAVLCILILPSIYALKKVFDPKNKVNKTISTGQFKLREIAATKEDANFHAGPLKLRNDVRLQEDYKNGRSSLSQWEDKSYLKEEGYIKRIEFNQDEEDIKMEEQMMNRNQLNEHSCIEDRNSIDHENVSDTKTMLLNGVQVSPFAQLISEHPEKADSITLVDCPFYIGTVKNQMNYSLSCPVISRYHAKVEKLEGIYYISDLDSTNGTYVNGRRLKAQEPNMLIAGDKVAFANIGFIFACPN